MDVSLIICTCNRAGFLEETLRSLREIEVPPGWKVELLLVDNASTDRTPAVISSFEAPQMQVRGLHEPTPGKSYALNHAVSEASGEVLLFTDDDVRFPEHWIQQMAAPIRSGTADAVAGGVELGDSVRSEHLTPRHRSLLASTERMDNQDPNRLVGANMAIARSVFEEIQGFNTDLGPGGLGLGEDTLLAWQLQEAGFRIEGAFEVAVEHRPDSSRLTREGWKRAAEKAGRSEGYRSYHWKHRQYSLPALLAGWTHYTVRLHWKRAVNELTGKVDSSPMPIWEFVLRRKIHRIRQHLREYGKPVKYDRHGLSKRNA